MQSGNLLILITLQLIAFPPNKSHLFQLRQQMKSTQNQGMSKLKQICGSSQKFDKKIVGKDFLLGKYFDAKSKLIRKRQKKYTKSKLENLLNIQEKLSSKQRTYEFYQPLHQLWSSYTADLLKNDKSDESIYLKLLRSDYHGALITVVHSPIHSYIGLTGIVIQQTLKTFKIINLENRTLIILKNQAVFQIWILGKYYVINGNCLIFRSTDRAKHKFKSRQADKINIQFMSNFTQNSA